MTIRFHLADLGDQQFLTVVSQDGAPLVATNETHSNFNEIVDAVLSNDERAYDLFDTGRVVERKFADVADGRIAVRGGTVYFDEEPLDNAISEAILRFLEADEDFAPLARYVENVMANPEEHSREQFYRWIQNHHFPISDTGKIVAYKGVASDHNGGYQSINAGTAFVNNVEINGKIPNAVGDVVTMPRSEVAHDPHTACHKGLHAGTWEYASTFGEGTVMLVEIDPRDVVSVPNDCNSQKVRVCRYEVIGFATEKNEALRHVSEVAVGDAGAAAEEDEFTLDAPEAPKSDFSKGDKVVLKAGRYFDRAMGVNSGIRITDLIGKRGTVTKVVPDYFDNSKAGYYEVHAGGVKYDVWPEEIVLDTNTAKDTRKNHLSQKRGVGGRFVPKGS